jgi:flagellin-like hook-associated protein FlgL
MSTDSIGGITSIRLASFYKLNQSNIDDNMVRISSGKRFKSPGIYAADYFHASAMRNDSTGLQQVNREIVGAIGMSKAAEQGGQFVFEKVTRLKELISQYYGTSDSEEKIAFTEEFNSIKKRITLMVGDCVYDGKKVLADNGAAPLRQVVLDPHDVTQTLDISFGAGDIVDVSTLTIGSGDQAAELNNVGVEELKAGIYMAKAASFTVSLNAFYDMNGKKSAICQDNADNTENTDTGAEYMQLSKRQISQQMTVSMMSQANMVRSSVLTLLGIK